MINRKSEHLERAPIVEAVADIRVGIHDGEIIPILEDLAKTLEPEYPELKRLREFQGRIEFGDEEPTLESGTTGTIGFLVRSEDGRRFVQLRTTGITAGHLAPYSSWDDLFGDCWRAWSIYRKAVKPSMVTRIATRFINRLSLPVEFDTAEYFTIPILVPDGLPDSLKAFNYTYVMDAGDGMLAKVKLASELPPDPPGSSIVLDSDCFVSSVRPDDDPEIESDFRRLRELKNAIFFNTLTEKTLDLLR